MTSRPMSSTAGITSPVGAADRTAAAPRPRIMPLSGVRRASDRSSAIWHSMPTSVTTATVSVKCMPASAGTLSSGRM